MSKPKIRFKGYEEDWEQRKLKETIEYIVDNRGKNPDYYCSEGIPVIDNFMIRNSLYPDLNTATRFIDENLYQNFIRKYNEEDDILLTLVGNGIGNITLFPKDKAVIIQNTLGFRAKEDKKFLFFLLMANNEALVKLDRGMAQPSIRQDEILDLDIYVPSNSEQIQIGEYFTYLDNLITLHQRKCEETKKLKKYMLQKMFPQNGKRVPEIRFVGFTEDWEQRKLSDITLKIGSGKTPSGGKNAYVDDGIPLIRSQNINNDRVDLEDIVFIDEETDNSMENSRVFTDDVLLNITGASIGRSAVYRGKDKANVNQHVCIIRPTKDFDSDFIQLNLASNFGQKQIDASQAGGGREGLNFQEIGKMSFMFPSNQEQMKIGVYFNHIDYLITLHQRKYEELQKIKKFMLQNMFI